MVLSLLGPFIPYVELSLQVAEKTANNFRGLLFLPHLADLIFALSRQYLQG